MRGARVCGGGPGRPPECPGGRRTALWASVGPWQYQSEARLGGWLGSTGIAPTQYPTHCTTPGTTPPPYPAECSAHYASTVPGNSSSGSAKEILGVNNAQ